MNKARRALKIIVIGLTIWLVAHAAAMAATGVLVAGHKNPDTDSISSAIGYAKFKQLSGIEVMAVRAGEINKETQYALNYFKVPAPPLVKAFEEKQHVILVDHNESKQAIDGLEKAEIIEIIDHHRLGGISTEKPLFIHFEPIGSTATLVANMYWQHQFEIPKDISGLLLSAIISDTVLFRSSTSTAKDRATAVKLAAIADVNIQKYGLEMLTAGADVSDQTPDQIVGNDLKVFEVQGKMISISQVEVMSSGELLAQKEQLLQALEKLRATARYEASFLMVTNIMEESTHLLFQGNADDIVWKAFGKKTEHHEVFLPNVMSRKNQVAPPILAALKELRK